MVETEVKKGGNKNRKREKCTKWYERTKIKGKNCDKVPSSTLGNFKRRDKTWQKGGCTIKEGNRQDR